MQCRISSYASVNQAMERCLVHLDQSRACPLRNYLWAFTPLIHTIYTGLHVLSHSRTFTPLQVDWLSSDPNLLWITRRPASSPSEHCKWCSLLLFIYKLLPCSENKTKRRLLCFHIQPEESCDAAREMKQIENVTKQCNSRLIPPVHLLAVINRLERREEEGERQGKEKVGEVE